MTPACWVIGSARRLEAVGVKYAVGDWIVAAIVARPLRRHGLLLDQHAMGGWKAVADLIELDVVCRTARLRDPIHIGWS